MRVSWRHCWPAREERIPGEPDYLAKQLAAVIKSVEASEFCSLQLLLDTRQ